MSQHRQGDDEGIMPRKKRKVGTVRGGGDGKLRGMQNPLRHLDKPSKGPFRFSGGRAKFDDIGEEGERLFAGNRKLRTDTMGSLGNVINPVYARDKNSKPPGNRKR